MDNRPISRSAIPNLEDLPDDVKTKIQSVQEKTGFVPNVFMIMARKPDEFRGFCTYYDAIMETECKITKAELEMIVVATSAQNDCLYCVVSHGAVLRIRSKDKNMKNKPDDKTTETPPAKPSRPSVQLIALVTPVIQKTVNIILIRINNSFL